MNTRFPYRIVITGIGLTAPNGHDLTSFRKNLIEKKPNIQSIPMRHMGHVLAGVCNFDALRYQTRKTLRHSTRAGSISIYCAHEAIANAQLNWSTIEKSTVGIYIGITEHGNVETENEVYQLSHFNNDINYWSHHHNPRTIANNPAGEVSINLGITGPHYTIGAACAAGNAGLIQAFQMLQLKEVDYAIAGGVSESIQSFGIFAGFKSQGALAHHTDPNKASRPFDTQRNGIIVSEGGCLYVVERLETALNRGAPIIAEIIGYAMNSDAVDAVLPYHQRQAECIQKAIHTAALTPKDIDLVSTHATSTPQGDAQECEALRTVFQNCPNTYFNNTKSYIGHAMGAAGALELAGNLPSFTDFIIHPTLNVDDLDPTCHLPNLVINEPKSISRIDTVLNNSFGMLGINSTLIVKRYL